MTACLQGAKEEENLKFNRDLESGANGRMMEPPAEQGSSREHNW